MELSENFILDVVNNFSRELNGNLWAKNSFWRSSIISPGITLGH
jgi:hypothetical protein